MSTTSNALIVPVILPNTRALPTRSDRMRRLAEKRRVMAARARYVAEREAAHRNQQVRSLAIFNTLRPNLPFCYHYSERLVNDNVPAPDGHTFTNVLEAIEWRPDAQHGRTDEEYHSYLYQEVEYFIRDGYSWVHQACNCNGCRGQRRGHAINVIESWAERAMADVDQWDRTSNPFSPVYNVPSGLPSRRRSRAAVPAGVATGAGMTGGIYLDTSAKEGHARLIGVEVEHNNSVSLSGWVTDWPGATVIRDGSCGWEAVTPPIAGAHVEKCLRQLMRSLNDQDAGCNRSCGLHVHVDARDVRWPEMVRFLSIYTRLEPLLFILGGQYRLKSTSYCRNVAPLFEKALRSPDPKGAILAAAVLSDRNDYLPTPADGRKLMRHTPDKKHGGRYKAVNIMPWIAGRAFQRPDTTIEFRLHRGSHNADRVIRWVTICQDIVDWAVRKENKDVSSLPRSAARSLAIISPRNADWIVRRLKGYRMATTASRGHVEDDSGHMLPRRLISVKKGLYQIDAAKVATFYSNDQE